MLAKEIMHKQVVTVDPRMKLRELAETLSNRRITGAPVVDAQGEVVGMVSQTDLARHQGQFGNCPSPESARVADVMTRGIISFEENTPVEDLARELLRRRIHRAVITRQGKFIGIVSTMDLLRVLAGPADADADTDEDPFHDFDDMGGCGE